MASDLVALGRQLGLGGLHALVREGGRDRGIDLLLKLGLGGSDLGIHPGGGLEALGSDGLLDLSRVLVTLVGYPALYLGEESGESGEVDVLVSHVVSFRRWLMD